MKSAFIFSLGLPNLNIVLDPLFLLDRKNGIHSTECILWTERSSHENCSPENEFAAILPCKGGETKILLNNWANKTSRGEETFSRFYKQGRTRMRFKPSITIVPTLSYVYLFKRLLCNYMVPCLVDGFFSSRCSLWIPQLKIIWFYNFWVKTFNLVGGIEAIQEVGTKETIVVWLAPIALNWLIGLECENGWEISKTGEDVFPESQWKTCS